MSKINICLVGTNHISEIHVNTIESIPVANITAIIDINHNKTTYPTSNTHLDYPYYESLEEVIDNNISFDVVIIATYTPNYYQLIKFALQNNKHVLSENYFETEEEIRNCFQIAEDNELLLFIGFQKRFDSNYISLIQEQDNKSPSEHIRFISRDNAVKSVKNLTTTGGIIKDMVSHEIDQSFIHMQGVYPNKVVAFTSTNLSSLVEIKQIENIHIMMQYPNGSVINIDSNRNSKYGCDQRAEIYTKNKLYKIENKHYNNIKISDIFGTKTKDITYDLMSRYESAYQVELSYFLELVLDPPNKDTSIMYPTMESLIYNIRICNTINKSIKLGGKLIDLTYD